VAIKVVIILDVDFIAVLLGAPYLLEVRRNFVGSLVSVVESFCTS